MCSKIFNDKRIKLNNFVIPCRLLSLNERGKDDIDHQIEIAVSEVLQSNEILSEYFISCFSRVYSMQESSLFEIQFLKHKIEKDILSIPYNKKYRSDFDFENNWPKVLYHIGGTYRRLKLYPKSLQYFNKSIKLNKNNYWPYLGKALVYYSMDKKQKAFVNIKRAEKLTNSLEVKYYKEILGF